MKNLIEKLNLTIKEFAELYEIPYNTVRQWYNGTRQAPTYIKKMIETIIKLRKFNDFQNANYFNKLLTNQKNNDTITMPR